MPEAEGPLDADEAMRLLEQELARIPFRLPRHDARRVLLAVSGGADSLAMLALYGERSQEMAASGIDLAVATVDHGTRPASAEEARFVGRVAARYGLAHTILEWRGWDGRGNFQARAREARYDLLVDHARHERCQALLVAHHQDDQIETYLLARGRRAQGSALAGMRSMRDLAPDLVLIRPFLDVSRRSLRQVLEQRSHRAAEDPSNHDDRFARVRVRRALADISEGERGRHLARIAAARRSREDEDAALLSAMWDDPADRTGFCDSVGRLYRARESFEAMRPATARRYLARAVTAAGGAANAPARASVEALEAALRSAGPRFSATLNGCEIRLAGGRIAFSREYGRVGLPVGEIGTQQRRHVFDRRMDFLVHRTMLEAPVRLVAMGALGKGNRLERTLPVLVGDAGEPIWSHERVTDKLGLPIDRGLVTFERVGWRTLADLRDHAGRPPAPISAVEAVPGEPAPIG